MGLYRHVSFHIVLQPIMRIVRAVASAVLSVFGSDIIVGYMGDRTTHSRVVLKPKNVIPRKRNLNCANLGWVQWRAAWQRG